MIPPVVASDRGRAQTRAVLVCRAGVVGPRRGTCIVNGMFWKVQSQRVRAPYVKRDET